MLSPSRQCHNGVEFLHSQLLFQELLGVWKTSPHQQWKFAGVAQNTRKHLLVFTSLLKETIKGTDEIHKVRSWRIPSVGASVPMELGCRSSLNPIFLDFIEASSCGHNQSLTLLSALLKESGAGLKIPSFLSWPGVSRDQPSSRSPPRVPSLE